MNRLLPAFIRNEEPPPNTVKTVFEKLTLNFTPGVKPRIEVLEEREHTVIPMIMLVEGVHNGSSGPILYLSEELGKTPEVWNHKPIVVYHPELNGQGVSACDPVIVNTRKVGVIMNTRYDAKTRKLRSEAWIERTRADKVDNRIFAAIENNEMVEVSTGLYVDVEQKEGEWKGETYKGIIRNIRADHLAVLPDQIGACSIADGAGLLRNTSGETGGVWKDLRGLLVKAGFLRNEMSFANIRDALLQEMRKRSKQNGGVGEYPLDFWVEDVYSNFFIYSQGTKLFRLGYESDDNGVTLSEDDPVEIVRVTEYRTVQGANFIGNQDHNQKDTTMNKAAMIAAILTANRGGWSDRKVLEGLTEDQIKTIHNGVMNIDQNPNPGTPPPANPPPGTNPAQPATAPNPNPAPNPAPAPNPEPATTTTNAQPGLSWEQIIAMAPAPAQEVLRNLGAQEAAERTKLTETIVNRQLGFTAPELQALPLVTLRRMHDTLNPVPAVPNYMGMAPSAGVHNQAPVAEEPLPTPVLNFRKETAAAK